MIKHAITAEREGYYIHPSSLFICPFSEEQRAILIIIGFRFVLGLFACLSVYRFYLQQFSPCSGAATGQELSYRSVTVVLLCARLPTKPCKLLLSECSCQANNDIGITIISPTHSVRCYMCVYGFLLDLSPKHMLLLLMML